MQKYILFICSIILCTSSLSAQLKEKVVSLTKNLNQLKNSISKPSGPPALPIIDVETTRDAYLQIFRGRIDKPEELQEYLKNNNYNITIKQAQDLYAAWKAKLEKRSLNKLLPLEEIAEIIKEMTSGVIKSSKDLKEKLEVDYSVTTEQAQKLYDELKSKLLPPPTPPPAPPIPTKKPSTGSTPRKPTTVKVTIDDALEEVKKAMAPPENKVFTDTKQIIDYLNSIKKYPTDLGAAEGAFRGQLRDYVKK